MTDGRHPVTMTPMRAAIARRMVQSKQQAPHFYVSNEIEMDVLIAAAERHNAEQDPSARVTLTAYLIRAVALALLEHPALNAVWAGETLERWDAVNVGVAIAVDDGLIAPALLDCGAREVDDIATALADLTTRTRAGRLKAPEMTDATFTLSNLGMFEVSQFTAIVTPPQVAILATGRSYERAVVRDGQVVVRRVMQATLSADHRAVDGAGAARFLGTLKSLVEAPASWAPGANAG
ncbi:MAG TPA: dihydrolipoamide acetyltransferase family protein [Candidatus Sulfomarinibacteraceae bacterium]|nr:dihydrolipoamide acetyltransferase family protein [Candidatus Sulfomarinibacteraceae bacterium]